MIKVRALHRKPTFDPQGIAKFAPCQILGALGNRGIMQGLASHLPMRKIFLSDVQLFNKRYCVGEAIDLTAMQRRDKPQRGERHLSGHIELGLQFRNRGSQFSLVRVTQRRRSRPTQVPAGVISFQPDKLQALDAGSLLKLFRDFVLHQYRLHGRSLRVAGKAGHRLDCSLPNVIRCGAIFKIFYERIQSGKSRSGEFAVMAGRRDRIQKAAEMFNCLLRRKLTCAVQRINRSRDRPGVDARHIGLNPMMATGSKPIQAGLVPNEFAGVDEAPAPSHYHSALEVPIKRVRRRHRYNRRSHRASKWMAALSSRLRGAANT